MTTSAPKRIHRCSTWKKTGPSSSRDLRRKPELLSVPSFGQRRARHGVRIPEQRLALKYPSNTGSGAHSSQLPFHQITHWNGHDRTVCVKGKGLLQVVYSIENKSQVFYLVR